MRSSRQYAVLFTAVVMLAPALTAASIDMNDPRRAVGREDDIRVDAQLAQDSVGSNSPLAVTFQIHNLTSAPIAFADRVSQITYDSDSRTIMLSVGAEIPDEKMPHVVVIAAGEKKTFSAGGLVHVPAPAARGTFTPVPRYVQLRVNVLRDVAPFHDFIARQAQSAAAIVLGNDMFDKWIESNDSIFLNAVPVQWTAGSPPAAGVSAEQREINDSSRGRW